MNINNIFYPPSTRNLFSLDLSSTFEPQKSKTGTYNNMNTAFSQTPITNKEINLSNKILIDNKKYTNYENNGNMFNDDYSIQKVILLIILKILLLQVIEKLLLKLI